MRRALVAAVLWLAVAPALALAITLAIVLVFVPGTALGATPGPDDPPPPDITVNEFMPEERPLSDCLSALPKPGCGSEARGGPRQAAVFGAVVVGLGLIGTRIVVGVRRRDHADPHP
ncbi:MAG: hypothetical protein WD225_09505 [Ilumatobacteraceae bacterium]